MSPVRRRVLALVALPVAISLASTGCSSSSDEPTGGDATGQSEVDVGFARDMAVHHAQAVDMAVRIRERTSDPRLRSLAADIMLTQQSQIGRMQGWLELWGEPFTSAEPPMRWAAGVNHGMDDQPGDGAAMRGMVSRADVAELDTLELAEAEERFLELMIEHHRGGVEMAETALSLDPTDVVARLARSMVDGQSAEIDVMEGMLAERNDPRERP